MSLWWCLSLAAGIVALVQLMLLDRHRRLLFQAPAAPRTRRVAPEHATTRVPVQAAQLPTVPLPEPVRDSYAQAPADTGVVYVDTGGHCTFADDGARRLLGWSGGERSLPDVLAGGTPESAALLAQLAHDGAVGAHTTALAGVRSMPVEVSGVALRDRDDNFWGAALVISRQAAVPRERALMGRSPATPSRG